MRTKNNEISTTFLFVVFVVVGFGQRLSQRGRGQIFSKIQLPKEEVPSLHQMKHLSHVQLHYAFLEAEHKNKIEIVIL